MRLATLSIQAWNLGTCLLLKETDHHEELGDKEATGKGRDQKMWKKGLSGYQGKGEMVGEMTGKGTEGKV